MRKATTNPFDLLGDPTRRKILEIVGASGPIQVRDIYAALDVGCSRANVSQHLVVLKQAGLVERRPRQQGYVLRVEAFGIVHNWLTTYVRPVQLRKALFAALADESSPLTEQTARAYALIEGRSLHD